MRRTLVTSLACLALGTGMACAADMPVKAPPVVAPTYTWTGCYVGGNAGGAWMKSTNTFDNGGGIVEDFSYNPSSWIAGAQAGCQHQWTNVVFGVEGTWSGMDLNQTDTSVVDPNRTRTLKLDEIATVVGKFGFAWDRAMLYGKAGWAAGRVNWFAINNATGVNAGFTTWESGWTAGVGLEYMVTSSFVLGVEADWYNFKYDTNMIATDGTLPRLDNTNADVFAVTARATWLFNWGGPVVARY